MTKAPTSPMTKALVPPRPNLGPEPWSAPLSFGVRETLACALVVALVGLAAWCWLRSRRKRRAEVGSVVPGQRDPDSPRERLIARAEAIRANLANRFGSSLLASTTEEIADQGMLVEAFGLDSASRLVQFLHLADRAKFDLDDADDLQGDDWEDWTSEYLTPAAGASTRIKGR
ncbi:MAG: hypothetical protein ABI353_10495 [Isosphaeraceae bacterium]